MGAALASVPLREHDRGGPQTIASHEPSAQGLTISLTSSGEQAPPSATEPWKITHRSHGNGEESDLSAHPRAVTVLSSTRAAQAPS